MQSVNFNLPSKVQAFSGVKHSSPASSAVATKKDTVSFSGKGEADKENISPLKKVAKAVIGAFAAIISFIIGKFTGKPETANDAKVNVPENVDKPTAGEDKAKVETVSKVEILTPEAVEAHKRAEKLIETAQSKIDDSVAKYHNLGQNSDGEVVAAINGDVMTEELSDDRGYFTRRSSFQDGVLILIDETYEDGATNSIFLEEGKLKSVIDLEEIQPSGLRKMAKQVYFSRPGSDYTYKEGVAKHPDERTIAKERIVVSDDKVVKYGKNVAGVRYYY